MKRKAHPFNQFLKGFSKMRRILPCALPCQFLNQKNSDQTNSDHHFSSDSSSSNSSLSLQLSLPSIPSLTPSSSQPLDHDPPTKSTIHHLATLTGHSSYIFSLALGGKHLYSGSSNGDILRWNRDPTNSNTHSIVVQTHSNGVKSIAFLNDKLLTAHHDHKIRVWKVENDTNALHAYKHITSLPTVKDRCMSLFSPKNYVEVRRHKRRTWVHHVDAVSAMALTNDGLLLYSVSWDKTLKIWRTSDFKCLESVQNAHDDAINAISLSNDGIIYTGSADKKIKVWKNQESGEKRKSKHCLVDVLEKHKSGVNALALSKDGCLLYSGACDRSVIVWEKDGGIDRGGGNLMTAVGALRGHRKAVLCLCVTGDLVCSGSADKTVRIWKKGLGNSHCCLAVLEGHYGPVKCLAAAEDLGNDDDDGSRRYLVYSGSLDCSIKVWKVSVTTV